MGYDPYMERAMMSPFEASRYSGKMPDGRPCFDVRIVHDSGIYIDFEITDCRTGERVRISHILSPKHQLYLGGTDFTKPALTIPEQNLSLSLLLL